MSGYISDGASTCASDTDDVRDADADADDADDADDDDDDDDVLVQLRLDVVRQARLDAYIFDFRTDSIEADDADN
jgi:hypothetical protein